MSNKDFENCIRMCDKNPGQDLAGGSFSGITDLGIPQNFVHMVGRVPFYKYTVKPTPKDAKVEFEVEGYTQEGNSITVPSGTRIKYTVSKKTYYPVTQEKVVVRTIEDMVELEQDMYTFTIVPTPDYATVLLIADGYKQVENSITVAPGTEIYWSVSAKYYETVSGTVIADEPQKEKDIQLNYLMRTVTIYPTPEEATVKLTSAGFVQEGNSITVPAGNSVMWTVSAPHYQSQSGSLVVTDDREIDVEVRENTYLYTLVPEPADALVTLNYKGQIISGIGTQSVIVEYGDTVEWELSKQYYDTLTGSKKVVSETTQNIKLKKHLYTYTIVPTPANAFVILSATGCVQSGSSIGVPYGTEVSVLVKAPNYFDTSFTRTIYDDCSDTVVLDPGFYVDLDGYEYTNDNGDVVLTKYLLRNATVDTPHKVEI